MAITNVAFNPGPLVQHIKTDGTTPVTVELSGDKAYLLKHCGLAEDFSTGATGAVFFTTCESQKSATAIATVTAAATGALGRGALVIQANNPHLAAAVIGPGVSTVSFLSVTGNPVVQIEPMRP